MAKSRVNAPVIDASVVPDDILAAYRGKSHEETKALREKRMKRGADSLREIAEGKARKPRALWNDTEHFAQTAFFQLEVPKLVAKFGKQMDDIFAIPNFSMGHASEEVRKMMGARAKHEGRKKGVFDICYPVARGDWHALYLEAKADPNKPSKEQRAFQTRMLEQGNLAIVVFGFDVAQLCLGLTRILTYYEECGPFHARSVIGDNACLRMAYLSQVARFRAVV